MIETKRLRIEPFEMGHLEAYSIGFDNEVTKYQYPDPFESIDDAREFLQGFIDEMDNKEMLFLSILDMDDKFVGSAVVPVTVFAGGPKRNGVHRCTALQISESAGDANLYMG